MTITLPDISDLDATVGYQRLAAAIIAQAVQESRQRSTFTGQRARAEIALGACDPFISMLCQTEQQYQAACQRLRQLAGVAWGEP